MKIVKDAPLQDIRAYAYNIAKTLIDLLPDGKRVVFPLVEFTFILACKRAGTEYSVYTVCNETDRPQVNASLSAGTSYQAVRVLAKDLYQWLTTSEEVPFPTIF
jgi:hypothetical protein